MVPLRVAAALLLVCAPALPACTDGAGDSDGATAGGGATLLDEVDDYRAWARAPGEYLTPLAPSSGPHGAFVDIYVNDVVAQALLAEPGTLAAWPVGSIIVKDGWEDEGETLRFIALMEKTADGWYWEEYIDDFQAPAYKGAPEVCTGCHAAGSDSVRAFALP
ncbi:MAG: hypothetical protein R3A79_11085 [Nannocystaceae bacterium]